MIGWKKYLFALIFLVAGIVLGIQLAGWITPKKHKAPVRKTWSQPAAPKRRVEQPQTPPAPTRTPVLPIAVPAKSVSGAAPRVAIVLDDWGYNRNALDIALAIKEPLTLAVLPHLPYSAEIAEKAHQAGHGVMLHMPMEPMTAAALEKGTIMSGMSADEVRGLLDSAIASVPHILGVNNHMGSKITQDARILKIVMTDLRSRGLFFMNSMVTGSTVGRETAGELAIPYAERDVFLDNLRTEEAVLKELDDLKRLALRNGSAIAIGHDEPVTLRALQKTLPLWKSEGIQLVKLSDLIASNPDSV